MRLRQMAKVALTALSALALQLPLAEQASAATVILGATAAGPQTDYGDSNHMNGSRFTTGASGGTVTSMSVYVGSVAAAPNNSYQMAIYGDSGGAPGALIARTASGTLVANSINTLPITATLAANTPYWLMYNTNGTNVNVNNMKYASGGVGGWSNGSVTFGTWPATFGSAAQASFTFSIAATYTTGTDPAPTVSLTAPAAGATVSGAAVAVSATATNAAGVQFKLGTTNLGAEDVSSPYGITWDTTAVANGTYSLTAVARSANGQTVTSAPVSVTVANAAAAPTVTITAPTGGATLSGSQTVSANTTNAIGVQFKLDGVNLGPEDQAAPFAVGWDTTTVANGGHTLTAEARNAAGAIATSSVSITVSNQVTPPPPSTTQPILVITNPANPFTRYYGEILTTEGLRSYTMRDLAAVDGTTLSQYDVVILGEMSLTDAQATMLTSWVTAGGKLIAMRPDKKLAGLLGLTDATATLGDAWLRIDTTTTVGTGLVGDSIQYHGTADRYALNGATALATLYTGASSATVNPAVSSRNVGSSGGRAVAFTYDLARSIVLTRQGNPAWAGRNTDGVDGYEASEMFFGANGTPDWNDLGRAIIPIADEQQRLLANIVTQLAAASKPLPRFWYFPRELKAVIVMTGDDHATGGTAPRFNDYLAKSPAGCNVDNWECIRGSSYIFGFSNSSYPQLSNAQAVAFENQGFEIGVHVTTNCAPWGAAQNLYTTYTSQLASWRGLFPGVSNPVSTRTHCVEWDDWATQAKVKLANGMRLDTDYYYYPASWTANRPGYFNGTALPMRFADLDGSVIDVYQATTQVTDESGQDEPQTVNALLDKAFGPEGYYTMITANEHTDSTADTARAQSDAIVATAQARGVPVVSGRQMLRWLDTRNASNFESVGWSGSTLTFTVTGGANGLTGMLPTTSGSGTLSAISRGGVNVPFTVKTVKGVSYAFFSAATGSYSATYGTGGGGSGGGGGGTTDTTRPTVTATNPVNGATGVAVTSAVRFTFSEDLAPASVTATSAELRNGAGNLLTASVTYDSAARAVVLTPTAPLAASSAYTATMKANGPRDVAGNLLAADLTVGFTTAASPPPSTTVGYPTIGASTDSGDNNYLNGSRVVTGATASTPTTMSVYVRAPLSAAPADKFRLAIYTDVNGSPGSLLGTSSEGTLSANGWNTVPISGVSLAANTAYWFIYNSNGTGALDNAMAYDVGSAGVGVWSTGPVTYGTWPASFGGATLSSARFSIYAQ